MTEAWYEDEEVEGVIDGVEPMCSILYQVAGKCNKAMKTDNTYSNSQYSRYGGDGEEEWLKMYQSQSQFENEDLVCSYIDSLKYDTYDETGEVILNPSVSWSNLGTEIRIQRQAMRPGLKAGLVLTAIAAAGMAVAACFLHGLLARKNIPWRPKRDKGEDPTDIARQNSGILMGRSRSGPSQTPLI